MCALALAHPHNFSCFVNTGDCISLKGFSRGNKMFTVLVFLRDLTYFVPGVGQQGCLVEECAS